MNERVKKIFFVPILLVILGMLGYFLLVAVYCLPTEKMEFNMQESSYYFRNENSNPRFMPKKNSMLDNYTDALMLLTASHPENDSVWKCAINATRYNEADEFPTDTLIDVYYNEETGIAETNYARYWHGYLIFLKPLLLFFDYGEIRSLLMGMQLVIFVLVILELSKKNKEIVIPFLMTWIFLNPVSTMLSLQYNTVLMISFIATFAILKLNDKVKQSQIYVWSLIFMVIGVVTSYLDLLTYPLVALGIPLIIWISINMSESLLNNIYMIIRLAAFWGFGYAGMWGFKWILGGIITGDNIIKNAIESILFRTSSGVSDRVVSFWDVLKLQIGSAYQITWEIAVICAIGVYIYWFLKNRKIKWNIIITFMVLGIFPFAWFWVLKNHSYIHSYFTYRELAISVFAFFTCAMLHRGEKHNG